MRRVTSSRPIRPGSAPWRPRQNTAVSSTFCGTAWPASRRPDTRARPDARCARPREETAQASGLPNAAVGQKDELHERWREKQGENGQSEKEKKGGKHTLRPLSALQKGVAPMTSVAMQETATKRVALMSQGFLNSLGTLVNWQ